MSLSVSVGFSALPGLCWASVFLSSCLHAYSVPCVCGKLCGPDSVKLWPMAEGRDHWVLVYTDLSDRTGSLGTHTGR